MERPTDQLVKEYQASTVVNTEQLAAAERQAAKHKDYIARAAFKRYQCYRAKEAGIKFFDEYVYLIEEKACFMFNVKMRQTQELIDQLNKEIGRC